MAASDQTYRKQRTLHIVFAATSLAMLVTTVWMFWDDYNRPFKHVQRQFLKVEEEMARRAALDTAPDSDTLQKAVDAEKALARARTVHRLASDQAEAEVGKRRATQFDLETSFANTKADYDSLMSFYNIEVDHNGPDSATAKKYLAEMDKIKSRMDDLKLKIEDGQAQIDQAFRKDYSVTADGESVTTSPVNAEAAVSAAEDAHKKLTEDFDRAVKLTSQKEWRWWDQGFRNLPVIDGFASPVKIQQYALEELPIDYSFKFVTRYDRCTTCHQGLEKSSYEKEALAKIAKEPTDDSELMAKLENAKKEVDERNKVIEAFNKTAPSKDRKPLLALKADELQPQKIDLDESKIKMFAAHPRLDLFVDANSPHSAEKFGCTICHSGQGSATTFVDATHTPTDPLQQDRWVHDHRWQSIHFWDYPMRPQRFAEAECLKCHHQVYDLIRDDVHVEAPKLVQGFNLVRELGCFGCHEIWGLKSGRWIGPDMRLEPDPPLDALTPEERVKKLSDPANPPGTYRKVGPNLQRIAEKTNEQWARQWIKAPRDFRPDTRMPHYYQQVNNTPDVLPEDQKKFPDAEIHAISHYLFTNSSKLLKNVSQHAKDDSDARQKDAQSVVELTAKLQKLDIPPAERLAAMKELSAAKARITARGQALPSKELIQLSAPPADEKAKVEQLERGRHLFSTRGCMACHTHDGLATEAKPEGRPPMPAMVGESNFGPNLSRLVSKLGTEAGNPQSGRAWLVSWLLDPKTHNTRTLMPSVQLNQSEADDIAAWLISQPSDWKGVPVDPVDRETLKKLARVHLQKTLTNAQLRSVIDDENGFAPEELAGKMVEADEHLLAGKLDDDKLKMFVGKRAIANLGCFGCHNIAGFEGYKPIGVGLNDWGKKDAERIAFEDSPTFVSDHFNIVDVRRDLTESEKKAGATGWEMKNGKKPYERFFADRLDHRHHTREGFLHLKLQEPRSFDYNRIRSWDDRARMPQFKFARVQKKAGESDEDFALRAEREEAEAREAVMNFVLGLIAEPIPTKFVNNPTGDRGAEVKGRAVLEKFNCAGCHIVRPGSVDFKLTRDKIWKEEEKDGQKIKVAHTFKNAVLDSLEKQYTDFKERDDYAADHRFLNHNAWVGQLWKQPDRLRIRGITLPEGAFVNNQEAEEFTPDGKFLIYHLIDALRFKNQKGEIRDIPASIDLVLPREAIAPNSLIREFGGAFAGILSKYLQGRDPQAFGGAQNLSYSLLAGPPALIREGEKAQPGWLYQFLLNPVQLRPTTVLRMPKFSLSEDDAMALVNYFTAVDRKNNPGIGLTGPYMTVPERDDSLLLARTREYVERLKKAGAFDGRVKEMQPIWAQILKNRAAEMDGKVKAAKAIVDDLKKKGQATEIPEKMLAEVEAEARKARQQADTGDVKDLQKQWETKEAYVVDAFKLVTNPNLCTKCHQVGTMPVEQVQGPSLALSADRLRRDWTLWWIASPQRMLHYKTVMPQNFPANAPSNPYADSFIGSEKNFTEEQIRAVRDFLMLYPQVADWPVLKLRTAPGTTGGP